MCKGDYSTRSIQPSGRDGSTKTYTLTKDNLQAIRDILNAYDTLLGSDVSTARVVLRSLVK